MPGGFDYIVVGGGAAGCAVAARLAEDPSARVLLLEEGPHARHPLIRMAGGYFKLHGSKRTFLFHTEPVPGANNRQIALLQGRTLGGGTAINSMCYNRGQAQDYDDWERALGCTGWGYADVLPYFKRAECNNRLAGHDHGTEGPLKVSDGIHRHALSHAFILAAQQAQGQPGLPAAFNHDFNSGQQHGVGFYQIMSWRGERSSSYAAYIESRGTRQNLSVWPDAPVHKVLIEKGRAVGVRMRRSGRIQDIRAERDIILCAGAFMSPKLLLLSGIGPAQHLKQHGIDVVADVPGVGQNYQDHVAVPVDADLNAPISLMGQDRGWRAVSNALQWTLFRTGVLTSNVVECGGFFDTDGDGRSDIQLNALAASSCGWGDPLPQVHRFSLAPMCNTCHSRGKVELRSANPEELPRVYGNYLDARQEVDALIAGLRISRAIMRAPALARYLKAEVLPGPGVADSDAALEAYLRAKVHTGLHPVGTCAMGTGGEAVVDLQLRVHGVEGLRVADASVMPRVIRGNTTAPTIMIAERVADFIKGEQLPPEPSP